MTIDNYREVLHKYWGYDDFRGIQRDIIESIGNGHDTLGLMPTGGGKSITFQVPALCSEGTCIVITPLIALMKDQVHNLRRRGIRAAAIYSGLSREEIITTLENCIFGGITILYVSPERLSSELFRTKLRHMKVSFITVDEAHCISQWGYDFRPSYLEIADIRKDLPGIPVLALTATATPQVVEDIQDNLDNLEQVHNQVVEDIEVDNHHVVDNHLVVDNLLVEDSLLEVDNLLEVDMEDNLVVVHLLLVEDNMVEVHVLLVEDNLIVEDNYLELLVVLVADKVDN